MFHPNPFDFNGDGDLDFGERAFRDEFLSGGLDADDGDDDYDTDDSGDGSDDFWGDD